MARRTLVLLIVAAMALVAVALFFMNPMQSEQSEAAVVIIIPKGAAVPPKGWSRGLVFEAAYFDPPQVRVVINVNNTIRWVNNDEVAHTSTSLEVPKGAAGFDSGLIAPSSGFTTKLNVPGRYVYYCTLHPWAGGVIIVDGK